MNTFSRLFAAGVLLIALFLSFSIERARGEDDPPSSPFVWVLRAYQEHISPVDGGRCPSVPSCSSYSIEAFKKHGFIIGWMMTVDRLIHEGKDEASVSPVLFSQGKWRLYDPVENNDFWWSPVDSSKND